MVAPRAALLLAASLAGAAEPAERVLGRPHGAPVTVRWEADDGRARLAVGGPEFGLVLPDDRAITAEDMEGEELAGVITYARRRDTGSRAGQPEEVRVAAAPRVVTAVFADEPRLAAFATDWVEVRGRVRLVPGQAVVVDERWLLVLPEGAAARIRPTGDGATSVRVDAPWKARRRQDGRWEARAEGARLMACEAGEKPETALAGLSAAPSAPRPATPPRAPGR
jgi:hypothetical protein